MTGAVQSDALKMSLDSAFWVWNLVANMAYGERAKETVPLIVAEIQKYQTRFLEETAGLDAAAAKLYAHGGANGAAEAVEMVTKYGCETGDQMTKDWMSFWMFLFARFRDGLTVTPGKGRQCDPDVTKHDVKDCTSRTMPSAAQSGYDEAWYARIVADSDNAEHYANPNPTDGSLTMAEEEHASWKLMRMQKQRN